MQSQIVQDLSSHVMALRQRGCEKLRDFVASNDDQTIENVHACLFQPLYLQCLMIPNLFAFK